MTGDVGLNRKNKRRIGTEHGNDAGITGTEA